MPGLQLDRKGTRTLAALIDLTSRIVEDTEHGNNAGCLTIRALDTSILATNVMDAETDATRPLRNLSTIPQSLVDALNAVIVHRQEKARRELRVLRTRIEERGSRMNELALRKEILGLLDLRKVVSMELNGDTHPHVLRTLLLGKKVALLQRLEPEVVKEEVTTVVDHRLLRVTVLADDIVILIADRLRMVIQKLHAIQKSLRCVLLVIVDDNTSRKLALVRVLASLHHGTGLRGKLIEFRGLHSITELRADLLGDNIRIHVIKTLRKSANATKNLVERNGLTLPITLHNLEVFRHILFHRHTLKRENYTNLS